MIIRSVLIAAATIGLAGNLAVAQTIYVANNNVDATPGVNVYTGASAFQNAINAAAVGDIIYVTPSPTSYGNVTILDKKLTVYGAGLHPAKDMGFPSRVGTITLYGSLSSGSRFSGIDADGFLLATTSLNTTPNHTLSDVTIDNCRLNAIKGPQNNNRIENLLVRNCIFDNGPIGVLTIFENVQNILITNNIMKGSCCGITAIISHGTTLQHNLIYFRGDGSTFSIDYSTVQNNILYGTNADGGGEFTVYRNNLVWGAIPTFPNDDDFGNTAYDNLEADPMFVNFPFGQTNVWDFDWDFHLQPGSPAIGAAFDGTDIGPTGGPFPFDEEGSFLPMITELVLPGVIPAGQDLQITIKAKGN